MGDAVWSREDNRIIVRETTGVVAYPTANEVYEAVFEGINRVLGIQTSDFPHSWHPPLRFSPFPLSPVVRITGKSLEGLRLIIGAELVEVFHIIDTDDDQVIIDDCWYPLDLESFRQCREWLRERGIDPSGSLALGEVYRLKTAANLNAVVRDDSQLTPMSIAPQSESGHWEILGLEATLYDYQKIGVSYLQMVAQQGIGCLLGDEMGLGKTLQVIGLLQSERNANRYPFLVIAPATLLENWRRELEMFAPGLKALVHRGTQRAGIADGLLGADVVITSYDTAVRDELILGQIEWHVLVLDEAQNIKNPNAQRTIAVKSLRRNVSVAVTGTPVENSLQDLWSLSDFMLPGYLDDLASFRQSYSDNLDDASVLGCLMSPLLLRRRVSEVAADLPSRIDIPQAIVMDTDLMHTYESVRGQAEEQAGAASGLVILGNLRMLCAHPSISPGSNIDRVAAVSPKHLRMLEILEEIFELGEKVVIFASFVKTIDLLVHDISMRWPASWTGSIDGRTDVQTRQQLVDAFSGFSAPGALVLNPRAAGVGLNIAAANHVIHYNPEWNPALTDQASARVHRRRQTRPVTVHHLFYADTVEEVILERSSFKRKLAAGAVSSNEVESDQATLIKALGISPVSGSRL